MRLRIIAVIMGSIICLSFFGCTNDLSVVTSYTSTQDESNGSFDNDMNSMSNNKCKLIVDNKEIEMSEHLFIDPETKSAQIPLLLVLEELGSQVIWEDESVVEVSFHDKIISFDKNKLSYGLLVPPGTQNACRKFENNEFIVDSTSARPLLEGFAGAEIMIDYDSCIIYINSINSRGQGDGLREPF